MGGVRRVWGGWWHCARLCPPLLLCPPSSPHLVQVRERIRINGQPISKEQFSKYFWLVYSRLEETKVGLAGGAPSLEDAPVLVGDAQQMLTPKAPWVPALEEGASPERGCQPCG